MLIHFFKALKGGLSSLVKLEKVDLHCLEREDKREFRLEIRLCVWL